MGKEISTSKGGEKAERKPRIEVIKPERPTLAKIEADARSFVADSKSLTQFRSEIGRQFGF